MDAISDFINNLFWGIETGAWSMIEGMIDALLNGVLSFKAYDSKFVKDMFNALCGVAVVILPCKIVFELVLASIKDEVDNIQITKKIAGVILAISISFTMKTCWGYFNQQSTTVIQNLVSDTNRLKNVDTKDIEKASQKTWDTKYKNTLNNLIPSSIFSTFGDMPKDQADKLVQAYKQDKNAVEMFKGKTDKPSKKVCKGCEAWAFDDADEKGFSINQQFIKGKNSVNDGGDKLGYVWKHSNFLTIIGFLIFIALFFVITLQISVRVINQLFFFIITPLCTMGLTNTQNPRMFVVWKDAILGSFIANIGEIGMLSLFASIINSIGNIKGVTGVTALYTQLMLFIAGLLATIGIGNFIQSLVGGYASSLSQSANAIRSVLSIPSNIAGGIGSVGSFVGGAMSISGRGLENFGNAIGNESSKLNESANNKFEQAQILKETGNQEDIEKADKLERQANKQKNLADFTNASGKSIFGIGHVSNKAGNSLNRSSNFMKGRGFITSNMPFNADNNKVFDSINNQSYMNKNSSLNSSSNNNDDFIDTKEFSSNSNFTFSNDFRNNPFASTNKNNNINGSKLKNNIKNGKNEFEDW